VIDKEGSLTDQIETATKMTSASADAKGKRYTIIVEHLDPELEDWQSLEYKCIGEECANTNADFLLSGLASATATQKQLGLPSSSLTEESVEARYSSADQRKRVCLLDPKGEKDLSPEDGDEFDVFLFGGILGDDPPRGKVLMLPISPTTI